ncbi:MAG: hypothetical protein IJU35_03140 [Paludibacteraceae bacterium]|nr:hypothetical protein [Paludibacteraceae bacterium]
MSDALKYDFYKLHETDIIWKVRTIPDTKGGSLLFSFDKERVLSFWRDYPHELSKEQLILFEKEFPYWAKHYRGED